MINVIVNNLLCSSNRSDQEKKNQKWLFKESNSLQSRVFFSSSRKEKHASHHLWIASFWPSTMFFSLWAMIFCLLFSFFFMSMPMCVCTCLRCVKMNLVISTSKMTNCHDGLLSLSLFRSKKSCSGSPSSFYHKQLPINVTFHLAMFVLRRQSFFNDVVRSDKVVFWFITLSLVLAFIYRSIYVILSHRNLISRSCHPMGQVSSVSFFFRARMKAREEEKKRRSKRQETSFDLTVVLFFFTI